MRTIEITTTQKVTIEYELAEVRERFMAFFIDLIILVSGTFLLLYLMQLLLGDYFFTSSIYIIILPFMFFYTLASEIFLNGQTLGKKAMGLKVVKLTGSEPTITDFILRWIFRIIDIWFSFGTIAALLVSSSDKNQRLGDVVANTTVIRINSKFKFNLEDILNIQTIENYAPQFPGVKNFSEHDMLIVKKVLDRNISYPNGAHAKILNELCEKLKIQLELTQIPKNKMEFLRAVLKDYIVLTR